MVINYVYTQPTASTFLDYKHPNLVRILFVLQHCVPPKFAFLLSLQKNLKTSVNFLISYICIHFSCFIFDKINFQKLYFDSIDYFD